MLFKNFTQLFKGIALAGLVFFTSSANAQVTTNQGSGLAATYNTLADAITALNAATIASPVIITLTADETAPATGYVITASGTSTNTIKIKGGGKTITAGTGYTVGSNLDAIFKIVGGDYITIEDFVMQENSANTVTTTGATNTMTEMGVALLYATTTDGAQNCIIQNNTISLSLAYDNTFGIYSNSTHNTSNALTPASATSTNGGNHGLKVYGNTIKNIRRAISIIGPSSAAADYLTGIDVGGNTSTTGNVIVNMGGAIGSGFNLIDGASYGISLRNVKAINVAYNSITSTDGTTAYIGSVFGIDLLGASVTHTETFTSTITNNIIDIRSGATTSIVYGITAASTFVPNTGTFQINCNRFKNLTHTTTGGTGNIAGINDNCTALNTTINGNVFDNITLASLPATFYFINAPFNIPANGSKIVNNNSILGSFSKTAIGNAQIYLYQDNSSANGAGSYQENKNNNFSNITLAAPSSVSYSFYGWNNVATGNITIANNTIKNVVSNYTGAVYGITFGPSSTTASTTIIISNNIISDFRTNGPTFLINGSGNLTSIYTATISDNIINNMFLVGSNSTRLEGITIYGGATLVIDRNKISNFEYQTTSALSGNVLGIGITTDAASNTTIQNNIVGDLRSPNHSIQPNNPSLTGIFIRAGNYIVNNNSVYLNASSTGTDYSTYAFYALTTSVFTLKNNLFVNLSTPNGIGKTIGVGSNGAFATNYNSASNRNLIYVGTPSTSRVIYYDGTYGDQTLTDFKTRVSPREANSISIDPTFLSTTPGHVNYLHIDPTVSSAINGGASVVAGLTTDIDGETRDVSTPDIGADEYTPTGTACTPPTPTISVSGSATICNCNSITLTATGAGASGTYKWSTGETTAAITVSSPGVYTVIATNTAGCRAEASQTVTVSSTPIVTVAAAPSTYTWSVDGQAYTQSGTYTAVVGCVTNVLKLEINPSINLPVQWLQVSGTVLENGKAKLSWKVAEQQVKAYVVEKSMDGRTFNFVNSVSAKGNGTNEYNFMDDQAMSTKAWYRIKQIDLDGKFSYSAVLVLNKRYDAVASKIYPNPTSGNLTLTVDASKLGKQAILMNSAGAPMQTIKISSTALNINISNYPAGVYYIKIEDEGVLKFSKVN